MIKTLFSKFSGSQFARNAFLLTSGTAFAQLIPILLQPLLRRMFTPAEYGIYSIYLSIVGILTIAATFRYDNAIVLPRSDKKAINILGLSVLVNLIINILLLLVVIIVGNQLIILLKIPLNYGYIIYLIPAGVFLFCFQQTLNFWLIRKSAFGESAINKITRRAVEGSTHVALGFNKITAGLILGDIFGGIASVLAGIYHIFQKDFNFRMLSLKMIRFVSARYADFPKFNLLPTLLSAIAFQMPVLLINQYYDSKSVGEFDLARLMLNVPLAFIAVTFSQVLLQSLTEKKRLGLSILNQVSGVLYMLLTIIAVEIILVVLWGPQLFGFIFGENWIPSGEISRFLVFNFALNFIMSSFTSIFVSFNKLKLYSVWQISYFIAMLSLLFFNDLSFNDFLVLYVFVDSVLILAGLTLLTRVVLKYERTLHPN